jgi:NADH-quinone oxidoreductase subunit H
MITFLFYLPFLLLFVVLAVYGERKISAFIQDRLGPMEVGYKGILQTVADLMKLLQKEDIVNRSADGLLFRLGPSVIFTMIFAGYAVVPLTSSVGGAGIETGVFFLLAIISLDVIGILLAGWGSNSKFSLFGAMRSAAQIISYEIPLGLSVLCVVMLRNPWISRKFPFSRAYLSMICQGMPAGKRIITFLGFSRMWISPKPEVSFHGISCACLCSLSY